MGDSSADIPNRLAGTRRHVIRQIAQRLILQYEAAAAAALCAKTCPNPRAARYPVQAAPGKLWAQPTPAFWLRQCTWRNDKAEHRPNGARSANPAAAGSAKPDSCIGTAK